MTDQICFRKNFKSPSYSFKITSMPNKIQFDKPSFHKENNKIKKSENHRNNEICFNTPLKRINNDKINEHETRTMSADKYKFTSKIFSDKKQKSSSLYKDLSGTSKIFTALRISIKQGKKFSLQKKEDPQKSKYQQKSIKQIISPGMNKPSNTSRLFFTPKILLTQLSPGKRVNKQKYQIQTSTEPIKFSFKKQKQRSIPIQIPLNIPIPANPPVPQTPQQQFKMIMNSNDNVLVKIKTRKKSSQQLCETKPLSVDDFQKGKCLGNGYFGQVYIVKHKKLNFICAMKVISRELIKLQRIEQQLIRQLKICSFVEHPSIVQFYGFFIDQQNVYILQELMTDQQVYKILKKVRRFDQKQTAYLIHHMLQCLLYLHNNFITHRDIKPENILMKFGVPKMCDFGWAVYDPQDHRTSNIGTLLYLSPENVKGQGYDRRNDIWGIGVLTYQMLIGNVPFNLWAQDQKHKIIQQQIKFPYYMQISDTAKDFIMKMLQKNPNDRFTIRQLLNHQFLSNVDMNMMWNDTPQ